MPAPFEWQDCGPTAHAIPKSATKPPLPGDDVRTLCGLTATLTREDFSRENRWWIPCCKPCTAAWSAYLERQPAGTAR
jgi:hypothetical protein